MHGNETDAGNPVLSDDGRFWWNGQRWVPVLPSRGRRVWNVVLLSAALLGFLAVVFAMVFAIVLGPAIISLVRVFH